MLRQFFTVTFKIIDCLKLNLFHANSIEKKLVLITLDQSDNIAKHRTKSENHFHQFMGL